MNNEYLHLTLHHQQVQEALHRAEASRHAADLPEPPRRRFPGLILDLLLPGRRPVVAVRRATMAV